MFNVLPYDFRYRLGRCVPLIGVLSLLLSFGCDSGTAPSIYDPKLASLPDPQIGSIQPEGVALAGVDIITITGTNFSAQPTENLVYFGDTRADVTQASPTQLQMIAPNTPQPELQIRLAVVGAENFSNSIPYGLDPPFIGFGEVKDFEDVFSIAADDSGNLYASFVAFGLPVGIIRITPEGERSEFISSSFPWADIEFGSDGSLYAVRSVRALFRYSEAGAKFEVFAVIPDRTTQLKAIAVDANDRMWVAGNSTDIYSVRPDKTIQTYPFEAQVRDIALFEGFLYVAGSQDQTSKVWRFSIDSSGDLGAPEEVLNLTMHNGATAYALAFSTSGHLYVGTDNPEPILVIDPEGTVETLYPGVIPQPARAFTWGPDGQLFASTSSTDFYPSGIIRITSRRIGYGKVDF